MQTAGHHPPAKTLHWLIALALFGNARGQLQICRPGCGVGGNEWAATNHVADEVAVDITVVANRPK